MENEERDDKGQFLPGHKGLKKVGAVSRATRFKNLIYDIVEKRADELTTKDILEIAKLAAKFVPKEIGVKGEFQHTGFIENMIKKAEALQAEQDSQKEDTDD